MRRVIAFPGRKPRPSMGCSASKSTSAIAEPALEKDAVDVILKPNDGAAGDSLELDRAHDLTILGRGSLKQCARSAEGIPDSAACTSLTPHAAGAGAP